MVAADRFIIFPRPGRHVDTIIDRSIGRPGRPICAGAGRRAGGRGRRGRREQEQEQEQECPRAHTRAAHGNGCVGDGGEDGGKDSA